MMIAARWFVLLVVVVALVVIPFVLLEEQISAYVAERVRDDTPAFELMAVIIAALAVDVFLPIPSNLINTAAGALLGFGLATVVCWVGMMLGCLIGYGVGATGGTALVRRLQGDDTFARAHDMAERVGVPLLVLSRPVPVLAETSTFAAGATRYSLWRFLIVVGLSNLGISAAYAAVGAFAVELNSFVVAVVGAVLVPMIGLAGHLIWRRYQSA